MIVDVHAHYFPPEYFRRLDRPLVVPASAVLGHQSLDERLELLDRTTVDVQVLSIGHVQPYLDSGDRALEAARLLNDELVEVCEAHPRRFRAFVSLPLPHVKESLDELERTSGLDAVVGVTIGCSVGDRPLDDGVFAPVFDELSRRRRVVLVHPVGRPVGTWVGELNLTWIVGAPVEDTEAAVRLVLSGTTARYPGMQVIVPHLGGALPFLSSRIERVSRRQGIADGLRQLYFDTVSGSPAALRCACETVGSDRLLFGTDYPYCDGPEFEAHLGYLSDIGLSDDDVRHIAGDRAAALLGLTPEGDSPPAVP